MLYGKPPAGHRPKHRRPNDRPVLTVLAGIVVAGATAGALMVGR